MRKIVVLAVVCGSALLTGCFKTELASTVAGARVVITELRSGDRIQGGLRSRDFDDYLADESQQSWDELNDLLRFAELGNFFPETSRFKRRTLYLLTASGGEDMDADSDGLEDRRYQPVSGRWRAIVQGSQLREGNYLVSVVTEALYQLVKDDIDSLGDSQLLERLDELSAEFLDDVNRDGRVDYEDALGWSALYHRGLYRGDPELLLAMATAITNADSQARITEIARQLGGQAQAPLDFYTQNISMQIVQRRCVNCHVNGGVADARGARLIFVTNSVNNFAERNLQAFIDFDRGLGSQDLSDYVTGKASARLSHGGGQQLAPGSVDLMNLDTFLSLLE